MIQTTIATASTARIDPTTIGSSGTPAPLFGRTGLREALPLREPAPAWDRDRGAKTLGRIPKTFLASAESTRAFVRPGPETQRKEVPHCGITKFSTSSAPI